MKKKNQIKTKSDTNTRLGGERLRKKKGTLGEILLFLSSTWFYCFPYKSSIFDIYYFQGSIIILGQTTSKPSGPTLI